MQNVLRETVNLILHFSCKHTEELFREGKSRKFSAFSRVALRKLDMLDYALTLEDLAVPPANHLEALKGDRQGQYSIRINDQFRLCFRFENGKACDVEIVDYH